MLFIINVTSNDCNSFKADQIKELKDKAWVEIHADLLSESQYTNGPALLMSIISGKLCSHCLWG